MKTSQALNPLKLLQIFYDSIPQPKYRHADLAVIREKLDELRCLKDDLGHGPEYQKLLNAMSQIVAKLENLDVLSSQSQHQIWSNLSDRGMNKAIPPILNRSGQGFPVEWKDKRGNTCSVSNGEWGAKNYRVMDALGYMYLMKEGGDSLPKTAEPIFNDLVDIQQLENMLNGCSNGVPFVKPVRYIKFTDMDFRQFTMLKMNSTEIKNLLLETSRVEFKLTFPVRLRSTGSKENVHSMNYYSRFFEFRHDDLSVNKNGVVLSRRYTVTFNTLLGELTVNNLLAKFNDPIDVRLYHLSDSAQIFFRRALSHNNYEKNEFNLSTIAELTGLNGKNAWNLATTVENNILKPLQKHGYIVSFEKELNNRNEPKFIIKRQRPKP